MHDTKLYGGAAQLDASASFDPETGKGALFLVNRSQTEPLSVTLNWEDLAPQGFTQGWQMSGPDPKAHNSFEHARCRSPPTRSSCPRWTDAAPP